MLHWRSFKSRRVNQPLQPKAHGTVPCVKLSRLWKNTMYRSGTKGNVSQQCEPCNTYWVKWWCRSRWQWWHPCPALPQPPPRWWCSRRSHRTGTLSLWWWTCCTRGGFPSPSRWLAHHTHPPPGTWFVNWAGRNHLERPRQTDRQMTDTGRALQPHL